VKQVDQHAISPKMYCSSFLNNAVILPEIALTDMCVSCHFRTTILLRFIVDRSIVTVQRTNAVPIKTEGP